VYRREWIGFAALLSACGPKIVTVEEQAPKTVHVARPTNTAPPMETAQEAEPSGFATVDWTVLRGLNMQSGVASPLLEALAGSNVRIAGYMVPMDDGFQEATEFLLVPTAGACIHTPPPPGNQIVYATVTTGRPVKVEMVFSIWAYGRLEIQAAESPYGQAGYKMSVTEVKRRT